MRTAAALLCLASSLATAHAQEGPDAVLFERLPEGAVLVEEEEAERLLAEGRLSLIQEEVDDTAADARAFDAFLARNPEAAAAWRQLAEDVGPGEQTLEIDDRAGHRTVRLGGREVAQREVGRSQRRVNERATVERTYAWLYGIAAGAGGRLPSPREAARLSVAEIKGLNRDILMRYDGLAVRPNTRITELPAFPEVDFDFDLLEEKRCIGGRPANLGSGTGADLQSFTLADEACDVLPDGIIANDTRSYIHHLGCVRDQANRGTCAGFAIASAMETAFSHASQQLLDLSEQNLYARGKITEPWSDPTRMWDGLNVQETMERLAGNPYTVSFESGWNYNPSFSREPANNGIYKYEDSCVDYDETCSDGPHQAARVCYRPSWGGRWFACGWETQTSNWGLRINAPGLQLWDSDEPHASVSAIKAALDDGQQVVISVMINNSFLAGVEGDGFVRYHGEDENKKGSHAMHVVAYLDNTELAALLPDAPLGDYGKPGTQGEGGYLIVRNSWGPCAGDGGYLYLPYRWLKPYLFVTSAVTVAPSDLEPWIVEQ